MPDPLSRDALHSRDAIEPPLDPAAERLRRKLARLLLGSLGIMALGLIAVFAAILYRLNADRDSPQAIARGAGPVTAEIRLPEGAIIGSASLSDGAILIQVALPDDSAQLLVVDAASGQVLTQLDVRAGGTIDRDVQEQPQ